MQKGQIRPAAGAEIAAEAKLDSRQKAIPHIASQILAAQAHHLTALRGGYVRKQGHNRFRNKLYGYGNRQSQGGHHQNGVPQGLHSPLRLARANILRPQRRHGGQHGRRPQKQKSNDFFHNSHGGRVVQPAMVGDNGNQQKGNLNKAVL